jgi:hypothetical protein
MTTGVKKAKLHWVRLPKGARLGCMTPECDGEGDRKCRRCAQVHCRKHQAGHHFDHTVLRLKEKTGLIGTEPVFADISHAVRVEALTWLAKIRGLRGIADAGIATLKEGGYVAWAHAVNDLVEQRNPSLVIALRELHAELKSR